MPFAAFCDEDPVCPILSVSCPPMPPALFRIFRVLPCFKFPQPPVFSRVFPRPSAAKKHHLTTTPVDLRRWLASTSHLFVSFVVQTPPNAPCPLPCLPRPSRGSKSPSHPYFSAFFRGLQRQKNITSQQHSSAHADGSPQQPTCSCHSWFKLPRMPPALFRAFRVLPVVQIPPPTRIFPRFSAAFSGKKTSPHQQHSSAYADGSPQHPTCSCHSGFKIPRMPPALFRAFRVLPVVQIPPATPIFPRFSAAFSGKKTSPHQQHSSAYADGSPQHPTYSCHSWFKIPRMPPASSVPSASFPWFRFPQPPVFFRVFQRPSASKDITSPTPDGFRK